MFLPYKPTYIKNCHIQSGSEYQKHLNNILFGILYSDCKSICIPDCNSDVPDFLVSCKCKVYSVILGHGESFSRLPNKNVVSCIQIVKASAYQTAIQMFRTFWMQFVHDRLTTSHLGELALTQVLINILTLARCSLFI